MTRFGVSFLLAVGVVSLFAGNRSAVAQDNEAIVAEKKAALVIETRGVVPVKPTTFYLKVDVYVDGTGRASLQEKHQKSLATLRAAIEKLGFHIDYVTPPTLLRRVGEFAYQGVTGQDNRDAPPDVFRVAGSFTFAAANAAKAQAAFSALRAPDLPPSDLTVSYGVTDEETAHRAALKAAIDRANQRVHVLGEAAKPKIFELVYFKENDFQMPSASTVLHPQGKEPFRLVDTIDVETNITLFYGFKPTTVATTLPKPVNAKPPAKTVKKL